MGVTIVEKRASSRLSGVYQLNRLVGRPPLPAGGLWQKGALVGKPAGVFVSIGTQVRRSFQESVLNGLAGRAVGWGAPDALPGTLAASADWCLFLPVCLPVNAFHCCTCPHGSSDVPCASLTVHLLWR